MAKHLKVHQPWLLNPAQSPGTQVPALSPWFSHVALLQGPFLWAQGGRGGSFLGALFPGGPNQPKAHKTCLPSFLQSPLKNRYVNIPPWGRGNENPKLHFALEHIVVLNKLMQFRGGPTPREGQGGGGRRAEMERQMGNNYQLRLCPCWSFPLAQISLTLHVRYQMQVWLSAASKANTQKTGAGVRKDGLFKCRPPGKMGDF